VTQSRVRQAFGRLRGFVKENPITAEDMGAAGVLWWTEEAREAIDEAYGELYRFNGGETGIMVRLVQLLKMGPGE
jgi:hypothetical protein